VLSEEGEGPIDVTPFLVGEPGLEGQGAPVGDERR
jgi:hypothetical protein